MVVVVIKNLSFSVTSCLISFDLNFVFVLFDLSPCSVKFSLVTQTKRGRSNDALPSSTNVHAHIIDKEG